MVDHKMAMGFSKPVSASVALLTSEALHASIQNQAFASNITYVAQLKKGKKHWLWASCQV